MNSLYYYSKGSPIPLPITYSTISALSARTIGESHPIALLMLEVASACH